MLFQNKCQNLVLFNVELSYIGKVNLIENQPVFYLYVCSGVMEK